MTYKYKEIQGIKIAYRDEGKGMPLFMIPPWTSGSLAYEKLTGLLIKNNHRVIRVDLPGWGGEGFKDVIDDTSFDKYLSIVSDFVNSFNFKEYGMLGYSIGVTFILQGIARGLFMPNKVVAVSGFQEHSDIFDSALYKNLRYYPYIKNITGLHGIFKRVMKAIYTKEAQVGEIYERDGERDLFFRIINENMKCDIGSVMDPVYSIGDMNIKELLKYTGKVAVVYNMNEPVYYQESNRKIAQQFGIEPFVIDAFDHRHLSFEPEKSVEYIDNFLKS